jgi:mono/diheme cytochrome c family protein
MIVSMKLHHKLTRSVCILVPVFALLGACGSETAEERADATTDESFAQDCGACHSVANNAPSIEDLRALSSEELRAGIMSHPSAGDIPDRLTAARIDGLIQYLD